MNANDPVDPDAGGLERGLHLLRAVTILDRPHHP
jgi:hypothetical protein